MAAPTFNELIAFACGELAPAQAEQVAAFVERDAVAAAAVRAWRMMRETVAQDDSVEPPASVLARVKAIFTPHAEAGAASLASAARGWLDSVERFVAMLIYDSRVQPATVRYAQADDRILLTFATEDGEVDVQAERVHDESTPGPASLARWRIVGQSSDSRAAQCDIALMRTESSEIAGESVTDARGAFAFDATAGRYELVIRQDAGRVIVLTPLELT